MHTNSITFLSDTDTIRQLPHTHTHKHTHTLTGKQNFTLVYQKLRSYIYLHSYGLNKQTGYFGPIFALYLWPIFPFYKIF